LTIDYFMQQYSNNFRYMHTVKREGLI